MGCMLYVFHNVYVERSYYFLTARLINDCVKPIDVDNSLVALNNSFNSLNLIIIFSSYYQKICVL